MLRCAPRARPAPAARPFPFLGLGRGPISPAFSPLRTGIPRDPSFFVGCGEQKGQVQSDTQSSPRRAITSRSTRDCRPASTSTRPTSGLRRCCHYGIYSGLRTATYDNFDNAPHLGGTTSSPGFIITHLLSIHHLRTVQYSNYRSPFGGTSTRQFPPLLKNGPI